MKHYHVVAAIIKHEGRYLCMQKGCTRYEYTSFKYEFPDGKVEEGETEPQALIRELLEEMNFPIKVRQHVCTIDYQYPDFGITLSAYLCEAENNVFEMKEHIGYKWLPIDDLFSVKWTAADVSIVEYLIAHED